MCNLTVDGISNTFGVLLEPLVHAFSANRSEVAWVGSLLSGVYGMSGPIVGGLVNKFGCRPVCIVGSIISCTGIALSMFSPNVCGCFSSKYSSRVPRYIFGSDRSPCNTFFNFQTTPCRTNPNSTRSGSGVAK